MKQLIFCAVLTCVAGFVNAQTASGQQGSKNTRQVSGTSKKADSKKKDTITNNRVIYRSKRTGQAATPTGQQATGTNGTHANNPKNAGKSSDE